MNFVSKISPVWPLRLGLGVMFLYSGIDLVRHPTAWIWALPYWLREFISGLVPVETYLRLQGGAEIILAIILLGWFMPGGLVRLAALLVSVEFAVILALAFLPFSETNFLITFRDIGLLGAGSALFLALKKQNGTAAQP